MILPLHSSRFMLAALMAVLVTSTLLPAPAAADRGDRVKRITVNGKTFGTTRDVDEVEPNDSVGAAQDVGEPDVSINSSVFFIEMGSNPCGEPGDCKQGPDFYAFTIGATSDVSIYGLAPDPDFTYSGTLYGADGGSVGSVANGELHTTLEPGRYVFGNSLTATNPNLAGVVFNILILATPKNLGPSDVQLVVASADGPAVSGAPLTLSATAINVGSKATTATVTTAVPAGTTLASAATSRGSLSAPAPGGTGPITLSVTLSPREQATATLVLNVTAAPGETLRATASVELSPTDTNPNNNTVSGAVTVIAGPQVQLTVTAPAGGDLAAPGLTASPADQLAAPAAAPARPTGYRVYRSPQPNVRAVPANLVAQLGAEAGSLRVPVSGAGTYFVATAVYPNGESAPSNEVKGSVAGPRVDAVVVSAKKVSASGDFPAGTKVFVNGVGFSSAAVIKKAGAKLIQKGGLSNGAPLSSVARPGSTAIVSIQGPDGGLTLVPARVN